MSRRSTAEGGVRVLYSLQGLPAELRGALASPTSLSGDGMRRVWPPMSSSSSSSSSASMRVDNTRLNDTGLVNIDGSGSSMLSFDVYRTGSGWKSSSSGSDSGTGFAYVRRGSDGGVISDSSGSDSDSDAFALDAEKRVQNELDAQQRVRVDVDTLLQAPGGAGYAPLVALGEGGYGCTYRGRYGHDVPFRALKLQHLKGDATERERRWRRVARQFAIAKRVSERMRGASPCFLQYLGVERLATPRAFRAAVDASECPVMQQHLTAHRGEAAWSYAVTAMELADRGTLYSLLETGALRDLQAAIKADKTRWPLLIHDRAVNDIVRTLTAGLVAAYQRTGFVHGDLKPENIGFKSVPADTVLSMALTLAGEAGETMRVLAGVAAYGALDAPDASFYRDGDARSASVVAEGKYALLNRAGFRAMVYSMPGVPVLLDFDSATLRDYTSDAPLPYTTEYASALRLLRWRGASRCVHDAYALGITMLYIACEELRRDPWYFIRNSRGETASDDSSVCAIVMSCVLTAAFDKNLRKPTTQLRDCLPSRRAEEYVVKRSRFLSVVHNQDMTTWLRLGVQKVRDFSVSDIITLTYGEAGLRFFKELVSIKKSPDWQWANSRAMADYLEEFRLQDLLPALFQKAFAATTPKEQEARAALTSAPPATTEYSDAAVA